MISAMARLAAENDVVIVDTPGADTFLNRLCHAFADTLVTPLNDSFVDLDVLAQVEGEVLRIVGPSHYSEMVWQQKIRRASAKRGPVDWVVLRNRLSNLDARNKRAMAAALDELSRRFGFRIVNGLGERVVYRELFPLGLTLMDLPRAGEPFQMGHVAARQEIRGFLDALRLF
jgi:chromosome partitioning protein